VTFSRLAVFALISFNAACAVKNIRRLRLILNAAIVCAGIFLLMPCAFAGRFLTATRYSVGGIDPQFIAAADLNGDGNVDLVTTNFGTSHHPGSTISVLLGKGDGTFQKAVSYPSGGIKPLWIAVGDFNGNGKPDLAVWNTCGLVTCSLPFVQILLNNGDGTFRAGAAYSSSSSASSLGGPLLAGDFNGDGKLDVVVANEGVILLGNGDGTFSRFTTSFSCVPQVVADFNGDGKLDLAGYASNNLVVVLGNGDGTFHQSASYPVKYTFEPGNTSNDLAVADANNDGKLDLITAGINSIAVNVYLGNGDGSFQSAITTQTLTSGHMAVADFNGDGKVDVAVEAPIHEVLLLLGNGDGSFTVQPYSYDTEAFGRMVAADFNKDGKVDLAVLAWTTKSVDILLGNKQDTFLAAKLFPGADLEVAGRSSGRPSPSPSQLQPLFRVRALQAEQFSSRMALRCYRRRRSAKERRPSQLRV